jgi:two-component system OmpR family sensor kinase
MAAVSMAGRLTRNLTLVLSLCWLVAVTAAAMSVRYEMNEVFDSVLMEAAQQLLPDIIASQGEALLAADDAAPPVVLPAVPHDEYVTYQVLTAAGRLRLRSHQAPEQPYALPLRAGFSSPGGGRVYTEPSVDGRLVIQIAEPPDHRRHAIRGAVTWLVLPLSALVPLTILLVHWTVRRGLGPLRGLAQAIAQRDRSNMAAIPGSGLPRELQPILADVNQLLHRLALALDHERQFATNTAHELRSPMAAALAHAQLLVGKLAAQDTLRPHAKAIADQLRRLSRQVARLLELGRAEAGVALRRAPVDILPVLELVLDELGHQAGLADRLRLDVGGLESFVVETDADAAAIVLRNLVENALLHGASAGPIDVRLSGDGSVSVANEGPLLPAEALCRLTDRFHRQPGSGPGSGLGLAIVQSVMTQCGGSLELHSPARGRAQGFEAVLRFPDCRRDGEGAKAPSPVQVRG